MNDTNSNWRKNAHPRTVSLQNGLRSALDFSDTSDFEDANRGFIGTIEDATIRNASGKVVWSQKDYAFLDGADAPFTVNPSLWRMSKLNKIHGLFKVCDRIYQVRGFDLANITFIEGDTGLIVIDPLTFEEPARAALDLYEKHFGPRKVLAVMYSHSHRDHYGGVKGVVSEEDVAAGKVQIIAPEGFMEEVMSESLLAGIPSRRRAEFQVGTYLEPGPQAHVDSGLGKGMGTGTSGLIPPTHLITHTGERMLIDGVEVVFQMTPGTEAPAEMNFYFPQMRALNMAENACHTMHNLCPIRGAKVRDALAWASYLDESVDLYAGQADVCLAQHHWPTWGAEKVVTFLSEQRDLYRYLHDQTLRLMSHGLTPREISEQLMMPSELSRRWSTRGYYGAVVHNVQAIYAFYMGPYDGNPVNLNPLPPSAAAAKYMEYAGGAEHAIARAREDFERGEFRWVAQIMNQAVFADSTNQAARQLCADAFEQLGYQAESATWRNAYLLGARELREGLRPREKDGNRISPGVVSKLPMPLFFDFIAIRVVGERVEGQTVLFDWQMTDEKSCTKVTLSNGALSHRPGSHGEAADAVLQTTRAGLFQALQAEIGFAGAVQSGDVRITGNAKQVLALLAGLDSFDPLFNVVEP
ncbi:alkyl sulfatase dimerization domain-containing protein [Comamonas sp. A7-5]|uniref:alkyl/aryl-sulfatase n=1 Tax=Comamonas sp. A7-5 TaxID=673549 RepID=UPI0031E484D8